MKHPTGLKKTTFSAIFLKMRQDDSTITSTEHRYTLLVTCLRGISPTLPVYAKLFSYHRTIWLIISNFLPVMANFYLSHH